MTAVLKRAREAGIVAIDLEVDAANSRAISLYKRFGFRRLDRSRWARELKNWKRGRIRLLTHAQHGDLCDKGVSFG